MKDKPVVSLAAHMEVAKKAREQHEAEKRRIEQAYTNHLAKPISPISRYLLEPIHRGLGLVKRLILGLWTFFKVAVFTLGLVALYYLWSFHAGYLELTILSQDNLKTLSGDLLKPKVEGKKVK